MIYWKKDAYITSPLCIEKLHFILPWVCSCIDHRICQNVLRTSATLGCTSCFIFLGLTTFWCHLWCITEQPHSKMESMCLIESMYEFQSRTENLNHTKTITLVSCYQYNASSIMNQWKGKAEHATDTSMRTELWLGLFLNCWSRCSSSDLIKTLYLKEIFAFVIDLFILPENNYKHLQYLFKNLHTLLYKFFFYSWRGSSLGFLFYETRAKCAQYNSLELQHLSDHSEFLNAKGDYQ